MKKVGWLVVSLLMLGFCGVGASYAVTKKGKSKRADDSGALMSRRGGDDVGDDHGRGRGRDDNGQDDRGRGRGRGRGQGKKGGETRTRIALTGAAINGMTPKGHAEFRVRGTRRVFKVEVEDVNLADSTELTVKLNGDVVGTLVLDLREGELELNTNDGDTVPDSVAGKTVTVVTADGATVVSGQF